MALDPPLVLGRSLLPLPPPLLLLVYRGGSPLVFGGWGTSRWGGAGPPPLRALAPVAAPCNGDAACRESYRQILDLPLGELGQELGVLPRLP